MSISKGIIGINYHIIITINNCWCWKRVKNFVARCSQYWNSHLVPNEGYIKRDMASSSYLDMNKEHAISHNFLKYRGTWRILTFRLDFFRNMVSVNNNDLVENIAFIITFTFILRNMTYFNTVDLIN